MESNGDRSQRRVRLAWRRAIQQEPRSRHMPQRCRRKPLSALWIVGAICTLFVGCQTVPLGPGPINNDIPRELTKVSLPPYLIEPPDILAVDAVRVIPLPPHRLEPLDYLTIRVSGVLPTEPIEGIFAVEPDGKVNLGF